jgi:hypothetical protein
MIDQEFTVAQSPVPMTVSGEFILDQYYALRDINPWGYFGIVVLFVIAVRYIHYLIIYQSIAPYLFHESNSKLRFKGSAVIYPSA